MSSLALCLVVIIGLGNVFGQAGAPPAPRTGAAPGAGATPPGIAPTAPANPGSPAGTATGANTGGGVGATTGNAVSGPTSTAGSLGGATGTSIGGATGGGPGSATGGAVGGTTPLQGFDNQNGQSSQTDSTTANQPLVAPLPVVPPAPLTAPIQPGVVNTRTPALPNTGGRENSRARMQVGNALTSEDQELLRRLRNEVLPTFNFTEDNSPVQFVLRNGVVFVVGTAQSLTQKQRIIAAVRQMPGVVTVVDELRAGNSNPGKIVHSSPQNSIVHPSPADNPRVPSPTGREPGESSQIPASSSGSPR